MAKGRNVSGLPPRPKNPHETEARIMALIQAVPDIVYFKDRDR